MVRRCFVLRGTTIRRSRGSNRLDGRLYNLGLHCGAVSCSVPLEPRTAVIMEKRHDTIRASCGCQISFRIFGAPKPDIVGRHRVLSTMFHVLPLFRDCSMGRTSGVSRNQCWARYQGLLPRNLVTFSCILIVRCVRN